MMKEKGYSTIPRRSPPHQSSSTNIRRTLSNQSGGGLYHQHNISRSSNRGWWRLLVVACVGFYLGVTVTLWVTTLRQADSQLQLQPPHFLSSTSLSALWEPQVNCTTAQEKSLVNMQKDQTNNFRYHIPSNNEVSLPAARKNENEKRKENQPQQSQQKQTPPEKVKPPVIRQSHATVPIPTTEEQRRVQEILKKSMHRSFLPLTAVTEPPLVSSKPMPLRRHAPSDLKTFDYGQHFQSCHDLPNGWPTGHGPDLDNRFGGIINVLGSLYEHREDYAEKLCPVDLDPFLPWIHDLFPSDDGSTIHFVAHNKRRCRQDPKPFAKDQSNLEPQVALLQSVPVKRIQDDHSVADEWNATRGPGEGIYRLASLKEADKDGKETRFLCQFHTLRPSSKGDNSVEKLVLGETLSVYPYNYEHANYQHRRGQQANPMLTRPKDEGDINGIHNEQIWNAVLHFQCPVPPHLQSAVAEGRTIDPNGIPSVYIDIVPIRTPPRESLTGYFPQRLDLSTFSPKQEWGSTHILPSVAMSGRWSNVPICYPTNHIASTTALSLPSGENDAIAANTNGKPNYLMGCLWASAAFSTRGEGIDRTDTSTTDRLLEWLAYHLEVAGFDRIIIYDNTEATTNRTSLQSVTDLFGGRVVRIPWKHRVCNNNRPTHPNQGERSSQYAAESSCRIRYGPSTEWMISFDTDEYLIPQGKHKSMTSWLKESVQSGAIGEDTNILDFYQVRARLNHRFTERYTEETGDCKASCKSCNCVAKRSNATFLESFCEPSRFPKPESSGRAKKQIYRPSFVLSHFVHYSTVTRLILEKPLMPRVVGYPYERRIRELDEAFMIHTKTKAPRRTKSWKTLCTNGQECPIGFAWPHYQDENTTAEEEMTNAFGFPYNCYEQKNVNTILAPKLRMAMEPLLKQWNPLDLSDTSKQKVDGTQKLAVVTAQVAPKTAQMAERPRPISSSSFVYNPAGNGINDFERGLPAVIVSKIQGNSTLLQVEQWLCLLNSAYNDRLNYDIVLFSATRITIEEEENLRRAAAPAKFTLVIDNPGIQAMVAELSPEQTSYLLNRCNVTNVSQLTWKTRCMETSSVGKTNMPIQYTWQAEFRSLHLWKHPALAKYKYMMWLDSDGFCTKKWEQDPIATVARHDLAILFDHFPQGMAKGKEWPDRFEKAFGKIICKVDMVDGHLIANGGNCRGKNVEIKQIHGFFHVTNLDFYRSDAAMKWSKVMVGDTKFSRMFDDQIGVTMGAAVLAGNRSWDMRWHGVHLEVFHSYHLDGQEPFGGYLNFWKNNASVAFPEAYGKCEVTQKG